MLPCWITETKTVGLGFTIRNASQKQKFGRIVRQALCTGQGTGELPGKAALYLGLPW